MIDYEILDDKDALTKDKIDLEPKVYDISKCMSRQVQRFSVSRVVGLFYGVHVENKLQNKGDIKGRTTIILEEAPITLGRTLLDEVLSMSAVGRNFGLTFILTTQRLADVSAQTVQRATYLLGKHIGDNDLRKIKRIIDKEWVREVPRVAPGDWLYYDGLDTQMLRLPEYAGRRRMQVKKLGFWGRWLK